MRMAGFFLVFKDLSTDITAAAVGLGRGVQGWIPAGL